METILAYLFMISLLASGPLLLIGLICFFMKKRAKPFFIASALTVLLTILILIIAVLLRGQTDLFSTGSEFVK
ncbi:hypothetical protein JCM19046_4571 [Bacillus sp. JCM 19046]|nr:hypothetical protein JCM19045_3099 [Bacillus sp. JCM 19045]GAF19885.1 hypothetical protein JCM19046_4571 [Bacillus sp. JCM 19046]